MIAIHVALVALMPALALGMGLFFYFSLSWDSIIVDFFILYNIINDSPGGFRKYLLYRGGRGVFRIQSKIYDGASLWK